MKSRDLNDLNILEIDTKLDENEEALQNLKFQKAMQQLEDPLKIKYLKKEIAQLKTLKREFDIGIRENKS
jgi:large subunit ribosomal protein L29|tara:strand:+ start:1692 stop:1901 length:210 start_codon:yes stop_codon:yes gene_type:complete